MTLRSFWRRRPFQRQTGACRIARRRSGQALVELTLSITFIALLMGAAIDLGLAYKTYQTLMNATAEASTFLALMPKVNCTANSSWCAGAPSAAVAPMYGASREARNRFREEQGLVRRGIASTLDLNANKVDDTTETIDGVNGYTYMADRVRIHEADSAQISTTGGAYGLRGDYDPAATLQDCKDRKRFAVGETETRQCFMVVRTEIIYKPFISSRFLGANMTIRATSVKPIVGGP